jgi:ribosomal protein S18 acetylase RimI-like enzyme
VKKVTIIKDVDKSIEVMHNVGLWMKRSGLNPSEWWAPENMNKKFLLKHTELDEYYVAIIEGKPAASMVLQETERNQSWKSVDGEKSQKALYLHWLSVHRDFAGQGLSKTMVEKAKDEAVKRGFSLLRLDTDADEVKLCSLYEGLGFKLMGTEDERKHRTAFYQMKIAD